MVYVKPRPLGQYHPALFARPVVAGENELPEFTTYGHSSRLLSLCVMLRSTCTAPVPFGLCTVWRRRLDAKNAKGRTGRSSAEWFICSNDSNMVQALTARANELKGIGHGFSVPSTGI